MQLNDQVAWTVLPNGVGGSDGMRPNISVLMSPYLRDDAHLFPPFANWPRSLRQAAKDVLAERPGGGYQWTSSHGEEVALSSGALAGLEVVVSLHRPINLVVPTVRRFLGF